LIHLSLLVSCPPVSNWIDDHSAEAWPIIKSAGVNGCTVPSC
jgi:hypothetical protein